MPPNPRDCRTPIRTISTLRATARRERAITHNPYRTRIGRPYARSRAGTSSSSPRRKRRRCATESSRTSTFHILRRQRSGRSSTPAFTPSAGHAAARRPSAWPSLSSLGSCIAEGGRAGRRCRVSPLMASALAIAWQRSEPLVATAAFHAKQPSAEKLRPRSPPLDPVVPACDAVASRFVRRDSPLAAVPGELRGAFGLRSSRRGGRQAPPTPPPSRVDVRPAAYAARA